MAEVQLTFSGLSDQEVIDARQRFGNNQLVFKQSNRWKDAFNGLFKEPMILLLLVAATIYFITGNWGDGVFLSMAILMVAAISLYQDNRSRQALEKLQAFTQPFCKVIRNHQINEIHIDELVIGDYLMVEEGSAVAADGIIVQANDCAVNESILS